MADMVSIRPESMRKARKGYQPASEQLMDLIRDIPNRLRTGAPKPLRFRETYNSQVGKVRWIPVISWAHAGRAATYEELPKDWQESLPVPHEIPENSFAVTLEGDSMEPLYKAGDRVVVMPNVEPRNGCLVIAKLKDDGVVFKLYHQAGSGRPIRLTSYSPHHPPLDLTEDDLHWIYPVHSVSRSVWK